MRNTFAIVLTGMICAHGGAVRAEEPKGTTPAPLPAHPTPEQWARRCEPDSTTRDRWPNGASLRGMALRKTNDPHSETLVQADLRSFAPDGYTVTGATLSATRLVPSKATVGMGDISGATLRGTAGDGSPVDVVICEVAMHPGDSAMVRYRLRYWDAAEQRWKNPCASSKEIDNAWAVPFEGIWDERGTHRKSGQIFTFACETGVISKCLDMGYRPWSGGGEPARASLHQACTRMLRADYCGNGQSHTYAGVVIDVEDVFGIQKRTTEKTPTWDPAQGRFEAAWDEEGAVCMDHMRSGEALRVIKAECLGRFVKTTLYLGKGNRCVLRQRGSVTNSSLLRNRSQGVEVEAQGESK